MVDTQSKQERYGEAKKDGTYKGCPACDDYRDLLGRKDIDAVVIARSPTV